MSATIVVKRRTTLRRLCEVIDSRNLPELLPISSEASSSTIIEMDDKPMDTDEKKPEAEASAPTETPGDSQTGKGEDGGEAAAKTSPDAEETAAMDVDGEKAPPESSEEQRSAADPPPADASKADGSGEVKEEPLAGSATALSGTRSSKKRSRSPDIGGTGERTPTTKDPPSSSASVTQQHQVAAVSAASAAAAAQLSLSMGWNGLYSLLSATSMTTATAQSLSMASAAGGGGGGADGSSSAAGNGAGGSSSSSGSSLPTTEQVKQAALKSIQESPTHVHLSKNDSAPQLKIVDDGRLVVKGGMRGYRMSRATHGISSGNYYYEAIILDPPKVSEIASSLPPNARLGRTLQSQLQQALLEEENNVPMEKRKSTFGGHVRLGWSMRTGDLQAPVGYDKWSYAVRDINGSKIHCSKRDDHWGGEDFAPGDVIGCAIYLSGNSDGASTSGDANNNGNNAASNDKDAPSSTTNKDTPLSGSATTNHLRFFKNGYPMGNFVISKGKREGGVAFHIPEGVYYPAISLYMGASVKVNFGPHFIYQPKKLPPALKNSLKPVSDLYQPAKPMSVQDAAAKAQKEKTFRKPDMMAKFVELVKTEAQVLQETHDDLCRKHILDVKAERESRNLSTADLDVPPATAGGSADGDAVMQDGEDKATTAVSAQAKQDE